MTTLALSKPRTAQKVLPAMALNMGSIGSKYNSYRFLSHGGSKEKNELNQPNIMNMLRPLSPHLTIYKPQLTSTFSISHRISGAFLATIVLFFYLLCLKIGLIDWFWVVLSNVGVSFASRSIHSLLLKVGCSSTLAFVIVFSVRALITGETESSKMMMDPSGASAPSSSESPATPPSPSDSLIGHASSETDSDREKFFTPPQSVSSGESSSTSTPGNQSIDSSRQKESLEFLSEAERKHWTSEILRAFNESLEEVDPRGKIGKFPENELVDAFKLDSPLLSREEAETICRSLRALPWPSYEEADRTSVYARVWMLLEKHKRPDF